MLDIAEIPKFVTGYQFSIWGQELSIVGLIVGALVGVLSLVTAWKFYVLAIIDLAGPIALLIITKGDKELRLPLMAGFLVLAISYILKRFVLSNLDQNHPKIYTGLRAFILFESAAFAYSTKLSLFAGSDSGGQTETQRGLKNSSETRKMENDRSKPRSRHASDSE